MENEEGTGVMFKTADALKNIIASAIEAAMVNLTINNSSPVRGRVPLSDVSTPIPTFSADRNDDTQNSLRRVDIVRNNRNLSDSTIALLVTNKLINRAKKWYNSQAELADLSA